MIQLSQNITEQIITKLQPSHPQRIILFGSYAYGMPHKDSDIDLCVVYDRVESKKEKIWEIEELLREIKIPKDVLTPSAGEFEFYRKEINSVYSDIDKKGIVLWKRI